MANPSYSLTEDELSQFTGTSQYYQHPLGVLYTDGVQYMAERGGGYWIIDVIAAWQLHPQVALDPMLQQIQFWKLIVHDDGSATMLCERDTDDVAVSQRIPLTDFPLKQLRLYFQNGVVLLPSEY
ncbi:MULTISPECIES: DUF6876 family protein [Cyanophyceae]|uniref:DUF6876 family protein n=1 Tax=Cyanophyceae TaxID=3028117 RepID=UPI001688CF25|nr:MULTISPECIES: DUF6876 family protein [Cyanophyceae]MBD1919461.1 hypothetical protein [Phormidium sp. FACHB-77]MBD2054313.1 hypothetical protein [Leptolyngbya sp. FACHB-60]